MEEFETTITERKKFEEANNQLMEEKLALLKRIELEQVGCAAPARLIPAQGELSTYQERQAKVATQKADMEVVL